MPLAPLCRPWPRLSPAPCLTHGPSWFRPPRSFDRPAHSPQHSAPLPHHPPQITAKAYGAARDTNMTLDEAKWVSYRLYLRARDYFDRQQPREKRILGGCG